MRYTCELNVWRGDSNEAMPMWLFRSIIYVRSECICFRTNTRDGNVGQAVVSRAELEKYVFWTYSNTNMDSCYVDTVELFERMGAVPYLEIDNTPPYTKPYCDRNPLNPYLPNNPNEPIVTWCGDSVEDMRGSGASDGVFRTGGDIEIGRVGGWIVTVNGSELQSDSNGLYIYNPTVVTNASSTRIL